MTITIPRRTAGLLLAGALVVAACGNSAATPAPTPTGAATAAPTTGATPGPTPSPITADLVGAGASFPVPIYSEWISDFATVQPGVRINYRSIGSSGGREQFIAQSVDFAGSDAFMNSQDIGVALEARACSDVLHIPTVFGGVAIAYNIAGLEDLILDGETIAQIALGTITNVNDAAIAALNPGVNLPNQALTWVHRSDGSGTTSIFTKYLASVSEAWANGPGSGSSVEWPAGIGADQNDGVAAAVAQQPGGIGYVSYEFAAEIGLDVAAVVNKDGNAISPSSESVSLAASTVNVPDDFRFDILGVGGQGYPIAGATWIIAYTCGMDAAEGDALKAFLRWSLTDGTPSVAELNFAPLPDDLRTRVLAAVDRINEEG